MAPKTKIVSKRRASTSLPQAPPSPSRSQVPRERPSIEFSRKEIIYEKKFPLEDLKAREECGWTLDYLKKNKYEALAIPFEDEIYPRLVKLFYQHIKFGTTEDGEDYFEYTIDGHHRRVTVTDLGKITGLPVAYDRDHLDYLNPPFDFPESEGNFNFILRMFSEDGTKGTGESIFVSALPERVWLLDRILKENIYPLGHHSERRSELLWALYSAHKGHFYSMPYLLMKGITKMAQELICKTPTGKTKPLPYGYLITAILRATDYPFDPRESQMDVDSFLPVSAWVARHTKLMIAKRKRHDDRQRVRTPAGRSSVPPPAPTAATTIRAPTHTPDTSRPSYDSEMIERLTRMESRQERMETRQREMQSQHTEMTYLVRAMARHTFGDDYQRQLDDERLRAQRGKATAAEDSEDTDIDYTMRTAGDDAAETDSEEE